MNEELLKLIYDNSPFKEDKTFEQFQNDMSSEDLQKLIYDNSPFKEDKTFEQFQNNLGYSPKKVEQLPNTDFEGQDDKGYLGQVVDYVGAVLNEGVLRANLSTELSTGVFSDAESYKNMSDEGIGDVANIFKQLDENAEVLQKEVGGENNKFTESIEWLGGKSSEAVKSVVASVVNMWENPGQTTVSAVTGVVAGAAMTGPISAALVASVYGAPLAPIVQAAGTTWGGVNTAFSVAGGDVEGAMEAQQRIKEAAQERGLDYTNPRELKVIFQDEKLMDEILTAANLKGTVTGGLEATLGLVVPGIAGKVGSKIASKTVLGKTSSRAMSTLLAEGTIGGTSDVAGSVAGNVALGEDLNWKELKESFGEEFLVEMVTGGLASGVSTIADNTINRKSNKILDNIVNSAIKEDKETFVAGINESVSGGVINESDAETLIKKFDQVSEFLKQVPKSVIKNNKDRRELVKNLLEREVILNKQSEIDLQINDAASEAIKKELDGKKGKIDKLLKYADDKIEYLSEVSIKESEASGTIATANTEASQEGGGETPSILTDEEKEIQSGLFDDSDIDVEPYTAETPTKSRSQRKDDFVENNTVTEQEFQTIEDKIVNGETLSDREMSIYDSNSDILEQRLKDRLASEQNSEFDNSTDRQALDGQTVNYNGEEGVITIDEEGVYHNGTLIDSALNQDITNAELGISEIVVEAPALEQQTQEETGLGQDSTKELVVKGTVKEFGKVFQVESFNYDKDGNPTEVIVKNGNGKRRKLKSNKVLSRVPKLTQEQVSQGDVDSYTIGSTLTKMPEITEETVKEEESYTPVDQTELDIGLEQEEQTNLEDELSKAAIEINDRLNSGEFGQTQNSFTAPFDDGRVSDGKTPVGMKGNTSALASALLDGKVPKKVQDALGKDIVNDLKQKAKKWREISSRQTPTQNRQRRTEALRAEREQKVQQVIERSLERRYPGITRVKQMFQGHIENVLQALQKFNIGVQLHETPESYQDAVRAFIDEPTPQQLNSGGFYDPNGDLHINPYPSEFRPTTVYHEAAHAVFTNLFNRRSKDAVAIHQVIKEVLENGSDIERRLAIDLQDFIERYDAGKYDRSEEFFAELVGWLAANKTKISLGHKGEGASIVKRIKQAINKVLKDFVGVSFLEETNTLHDVVQLVNDISRSLSTGKDITTYKSIKNILGYDPSLNKGNSLLFSLGNGTLVERVDKFFKSRNVKLKNGRQKTGKIARDIESFLETNAREGFQEKNLWGKIYEKWNPESNKEVKDNLKNVNFEKDVWESGGESRAWLDDYGDVYKIMDVSDIKYGDYDTVLDILDRFHIHNQLFEKAPIELLGVTKELGRVKFILKQPFISGSFPTRSEINKYLSNHLDIVKKLGYQTNIGQQVYAIFDDRSDNFIKTLEGEIIPIDLIISSDRFENIDAYLKEGDGDIQFSLGKNRVNRDKFINNFQNSPKGQQYKKVFPNPNDFYSRFKADMDKNGVTLLDMQKLYAGLDPNKTIKQYEQEAIGKRDQLQKGLKDFGFSDKKVNSILTIYGEVAKSWSKGTGRSVDEFWSDVIDKFVTIDRAKENVDQVKKKIIDSLPFTQSAKYRRGDLITPLEIDKATEELGLDSVDAGAMLITDEGKAIVYLTSDIDVSDPVHELAHIFEYFMPPEDRRVVKNWAGTGKTKTEVSEDFAKGFIKYLSSDLKTSNPKLDKVFKKFSKWLKDILKGVFYKGVPEINQPMVDIYNKMFESEIKSSNFKKSWENNKKISEQARTSLRPTNEEIEAIYDGFEKAGANMYEKTTFVSVMSEAMENYPSLETAINMISQFYDGVVDSKRPVTNLSDVQFAAASKYILDMQNSLVFEESLIEDSRRDGVSEDILDESDRRLNELRDNIFMFKQVLTTDSSSAGLKLVLRRMVIKISDFSQQAAQKEIEKIFKLRGADLTSSRKKRIDAKVKGFYEALRKEQLEILQREKQESSDEASANEVIVTYDKNGVFKMVGNFLKKMTPDKLNKTLSKAFKDLLKHTNSKALHSTKSNPIDSALYIISAIFDPEVTTLLKPESKQLIDDFISSGKRDIDSLHEVVTALQLAVNNGKIQPEISKNSLIDALQYANLDRKSFKAKVESQKASIKKESAIIKKLSDLLHFSVDRENRTITIDTEILTELQELQKTLVSTIRTSRKDMNDGDLSIILNMLKDVGDTYQNLLFGEVVNKKNETLKSGTKFVDLDQEDVKRMLNNLDEIESRRFLSKNSQNIEELKIASDDIQARLDFANKILYDDKALEGVAKQLGLDLNEYTLPQLYQKVREIKQKQYLDETLRQLDFDRATIESVYNSNSKKDVKLELYHKIAQRYGLEPKNPVAISQELKDKKDEFTKKQKELRKILYELTKPAWKRGLKRFVDTFKVVQLAFDYSFVMYQGALMGGMHPLVAASLIPKTLVASVDKKYHDDYMKAMEKSPAFKRAYYYGVKISGLNTNFFDEEMQWMTILDNLPLLGNYTKFIQDFSNRGYGVYMESMRVHAFNEMSKGVTNEAQLKLIAERVNRLSGAGSTIAGTSFDSAVNNVFSQALFTAPRLYVSSFLSMFDVGSAGGKDLLQSFVTKDPDVKAFRRNAAKASFRAAMGQVAFMGLGLLAYKWQSDEEDDWGFIQPFSPDFGKIKIGQTRLSASPFVSYMDALIKTGGKVAHYASDGEFVPEEASKKWEESSVFDVFKDEFLTYRWSPAISSFERVVLKRDFLNRYIPKHKYVEDALLPTVLPISVTGLVKNVAYDDKGLQAIPEFGLDMIGVNTYTVNLYYSNKMQAYFKDRGFNLVLAKERYPKSLRDKSRHDPVKETYRNEIKDRLAKWVVNNNYPKSDLKRRVKLIQKEVEKDLGL